MFVSRGVMFIWDLLFGLFKRIVRNEKQVYDFLFFSLKRTKLYLSFD